MIILAIAIATPILAISMSFAFDKELLSVAKSIATYIATRSLYAGFRELPRDLAQERRDTILRNFQARDPHIITRTGIQLDSLYVPAPIDVRTGNLLILCLNTTYQDHHPRHWAPFYNNGADILLWNPTELGGIAYSQNLTDILLFLRRENPDQTIAIKNYCVSSDPSIRAVADLELEDVHLMIDRGFGDVQELARSKTIFANHPVMQEVLREKFNCKSIERIDRIRGQCLFFIPEIDQALGSLTHRLRELRLENDVVELEGDHWSKWDYHTYHRALDFLSRIGVTKPNYQEVDPDEFPPPALLGCFKQECLPCLIRSWC